MLYRADLMVPRLPWWWGHAEFHLAHQSNLIRKDPAHYGPQFVCAPLDAVYLWPTEEETMVMSKPDQKRVKAGERVAWTL
jgi:hypothetical protein